MSAVVAAPPPVNAIPATNGDASEVPAAATNNAGTPGDATTSEPAGQPVNGGASEEGHKVCFLPNYNHASCLQ